MFPPRIIGSIIACTLACGLLATMTSTAAARLPDDARTAAPTSSLAGTTDTPCTPNLPDGATTSCVPVTEIPRQDLRSPDARDAADAERIARSVEQYYQSLNTPVPAAPFTSAPEPTGSETPWLLVSVIAAALAGVLATTTLALRRRRSATV